MGSPTSSPEPATPASRHWLEIAVEHCVLVPLMLTWLVVVVLVALSFIVDLFLERGVEIPNVFQAAIVAQQVTVPAAAGWVAVNPDKPFKEGAELLVSVSGRVHLAMHQAVNVARLGDEFLLPPPPVYDCRVAADYLHDLGRWTSEWRSVDDPAASGDDHCRLSPKQPGGRLVYVVMKDPPDLDRLGPTPMSPGYDGVIQKGVLGSRNGLKLPKGGYVLLAVNDRRNCNLSDTAYVNARALKEYLDQTAQCKLDGGWDPSSSQRSLARFYDLSEKTVANASIGDNMGEYFVHITMP